MRSFAPMGSGEGRRALHKLRLGARSRLRTVAPDLHVLRPSLIPPAGPLGRAAQLATIRAAVAGALRRLAIEGPRALWFSLPVVAPLRTRLGAQGSVFYYQDRYDAFSHVDGDMLRAHVADLARGCEASFASAADLADDLRHLGADPIAVPHGVDVERFAAPGLAPSDLDGLERPLIGYVGIVDDYLALAHIRAVAEKIERGTVVIVGRVNADVAELRHPRIHLLGARPYESIPDYLEAFRVCLIPFAINRLTLGVNPIKLREYLAAGRPVVSTRLPEVAHYSDVVRLVDAADDFAQAVIEALELDDGPSARAARRARVADESWDAVAEAIEPTLLSIVSRVSAR